MKSTLFNMVLVLFAITLIASAGVGLVYQVTQEPIRQAKSAKTSLAIGVVVPEFDNDPASTRRTEEFDGGTMNIYTAEKGGQPVGYAVETFTNNGFSGLFTLMVGFLPDGTIHNIQVLQHAETPGLGSKMGDSGNALLLSFEGKNPADLKMSVKKDGGDVDALTASTITSRAYVEAVDRAFRLFQTVVKGESVSQKEFDPYGLLFPGYDNDPQAEMIQPAVFPVKQEDLLMGYAVKGTGAGYNGPIELFVGFAPDETIVDIVVANQQETSSFGTEITREDNSLLMSFKGKKADGVKMALKAAGGDIDGLSGSTVSSAGYIQAVVSAYEAFQNLEKGGNNE